MNGVNNMKYDSVVPVMVRVILKFTGINYFRQSWTFSDRNTCQCVSLGGEKCIYLWQYKMLILISRKWFSFIFDYLTYVLHCFLSSVNTFGSFLYFCYGIHTHWFGSSICQVRLHCYAIYIRTFLKRWW